LPINSLQTVDLHCVPNSAINVTSTATISIGQDVSITATVTFTNVTLMPGGYIEFKKLAGIHPGDFGTHQYNRAPRHFTNYTTEAYETWLPGDTYYEDTGNSIYIMIERAPPVLDLPVTGNAGDSFLFAPTISNATNPTGIINGMDVRGPGIGANCQTTNSDPNDQYSPSYTGPDNNGNYTIYLSVPNDNSISTSVNFTAWQLLDITFHAA
jgi:hypothetical protein